MPIVDGFFQLLQIIHVYVENTAAFDAPDVVMAAAYVIVPIGSAWNLHLLDFSRLG